MEEIIDIYDANNNLIGSECRDIAHNKGLWHHVFYCWIINPKDKSIVLQLRGKDIADSPNTLDISVAGHLQSGENVLQGEREIREEVGIQVNKEDLIPLGITINVADIDSDAVNPYLNREFVYTYFLEDSTILTEYNMQEEEVDGMFKIKIDDGLLLFSDKLQEITINGFLREGMCPTERKVNCGDFKKHGKSYFLNVFIMAERPLEGKSPLSI